MRLLWYSYSATQVLPGRLRKYTEGMINIAVTLQAGAGLALTTGINHVQIKVFIQHGQGPMATVRGGKLVMQRPGRQRLDCGCPPTTYGR